MIASKGLAKTASYTLAVVTILSVTFTFYERFMSGFLGMEGIALLISLVIASVGGYVIISYRKSVAASLGDLRSWFFGHILLIITGIHPRIEDNLSKELVQFENNLSSRVENRLLDHHREVDKVVKDEMKRMLLERKGYTVKLPIPAEIVVAPRSNRYYEFALDVSMKDDIMIKGEFKVKGNSDSRVKFYAFDQHNFTNFLNNPLYARKALDESPRISEYSFEFPITHGGKYFLVFENCASSSSLSKFVVAAANLHYKANILS